MFPCRVSAGEDAGASPSTCSIAAFSGRYSLDRLDRAPSQFVVPWPISVAGAMIGSGGKMVASLYQARSHR